MSESTNHFDSDLRVVRLSRSELHPCFRRSSLFLSTFSQPLEHLLKRSQTLITVDTERQARPERHVTFAWNVCGDATERISRKPRDRLRLCPAGSDHATPRPTPPLTAWVSSQKQKQLLMIGLSRSLLQGICFCLDTNGTDKNLWWLIMGL